MRTLTIILIGAVFLSLGILASADAKSKRFCDATTISETCNPVIVAVPGTESIFQFNMAGKNNWIHQMFFVQGDRWQTGNYFEIRSNAPFRCWNHWQLTNGYSEEFIPDAKKTTTVESAGYGDVPTPLNWYSCQVDMMGREQIGIWDCFIEPSLYKQLFVVEGYWVEED